MKTTITYECDAEPAQKAVCTIETDGKSAHVSWEWIPDIDDETTVDPYGLMVGLMGFVNRQLARENVDAVIWKKIKPEPSPPFVADVDA